MANRWENNGNSDRLFFGGGAPKSLQMVTAAMKLKDTCSLDASKVMLKILQARLQQYVNCEFPDVQAGFRKGRGTRYQIANICLIIKKAREFQENICFIDNTKAFDYVNHNKLWKILKEKEIQGYLTCLLRGETCMQVRKQQLEMDMEQQIGSK